MVKIKLAFLTIYACVLWETNKATGLVFFPGLLLYPGNGGSVSISEQVCMDKWGRGRWMNERDHRVLGNFLFYVLCRETMGRITPLKLCTICVCAHAMYVCNANATCYFPPHKQRKLGNRIVQPFCIAYSILELNTCSLLFFPLQLTSRLCKGCPIIAYWRMWKGRDAKRKTWCALIGLLEDRGAETNK